MFINAESITPVARDWLANSRQPGILHVFDHACNLINEHGKVLSLVTLQIGQGPFNLVIEGDFCFSEHLNLQSPVSISLNQLNLGDLSIHAANAKLWSPRPDWERLHAKRDDILDQIMSLRVSDSERSNPLAHLEIASSQSMLLAMTLLQLPLTNYQPSVSNLQSLILSSVITANIQSSKNAARQLSGLGSGLTPAGDDFILGAIYAAWIIHPVDVAKVIAEEITNTAAPLTTTLSAAWLRSAGRGEAGILWHEFFDALILGDTSAIQLQITKLLLVGATSGADALAGFTGTFICWAELESSKIP